MKYLINRIEISLLVKKVIDVEDGYRLITSLPEKGNVTVICFINKKKLKGARIENNQVYDFDGYLHGNTYGHGDRVHTLQMHVDYVTINLTGKYENKVNLLGEFVSKTEPVTLPQGNKVCNMQMKFASESLRDSFMDVVVWNKALIALEFAEEGQKLHLTSFIYDNYFRDKDISYKLSPFKVTLL